MYGLSAIVGLRSAFVLSVHVTSWLSSASGHCKVTWFSGFFFILSADIYGTLIMMMVCTSVRIRKSSGPCVCMCVCSLVLQRLRHLASFCMLLSCFVIVVFLAFVLVTRFNFSYSYLQLSRSLGSQLENGLTSSSRLDSSTADKMQNFWQDGVFSCMLHDSMSWLLLCQDHLAWLLSWSCLWSSSAWLCAFGLCCLDCFFDAF